MRIKKQLACILSCFMIQSTTLTPMAAELPISSFYSYDLSTGKETHYDVKITTNAKELSMKGSNGTVDGNWIPETPSAKKVTYGWITKGNNRYYRMKNGKLCTSKWQKIGKYYYSFDSKGRMKKGNVRLSNNTLAYFSTTTGRFVSYLKRLTVTKKGKTSIEAKDSTGKYSIPLKNLTVINNAGKKISTSSLKKNSKICVLYTGSIRETSPATFSKILKVKKY